MNGLVKQENLLERFSNVSPSMGVVVALQLMHQAGLKYEYGHTPSGPDDLASKAEVFSMFLPSKSDAKAIGEAALWFVQNRQVMPSADEFACRVNYVLKSRNINVYDRETDTVYVMPHGWTHDMLNEMIEARKAEVESLYGPNGHMECQGPADEPAAHLTEGQIAGDGRERYLEAGRKLAKKVKE